MSARGTDVLFICTANRCRSPMAAALFERRRRLDGAPARARSAGLGDPGAPSPPEVIEAGLEYGVDLSAHRSRRLAPEDVAGATLVVGLERQHVREAVLLSDGAAWGRAFTLQELVRRGLEAGPRPRHQALEDWLADLHQGRQRHDLLGTSAIDDVPDPMGGTRADFAASAANIAALTNQLVGLLWRVRPRRSAQPPANAGRI